MGILSTKNSYQSFNDISIDRNKELINQASGGQWNLPISHGKLTKHLSTYFYFNRLSSYHHIYSYITYIHIYIYVIYVHIYYMYIYRG